MRMLSTMKRIFKKSTLFTDVKLHGTQKSTAGKVVTYQFNITCKVKAG